MSDTTLLREALRKQLEHDAWGTQQAIDALRDHGGDDEASREALAKLHHTVGAEELWWARMHDAAFNRDIFEETAELDDVERRAQAIGSKWLETLEAMPDERLLGAFDYTAWDGSARRSNVRDVMAHLTLHAMYHRGQILRLLRDQLPEPLVLDFTFWARADD